MVLLLSQLALPSNQVYGAGFVGITGMDLAIAMDMFMNINVGTATGYGIPALV